MSNRFIIPIVEGHGEVEAVPLLVRRIFGEFLPHVTPTINPPARVKAGSFLNDPAYFTRFITLAAAKAAQGQGTVLILLDCEDHCPGQLGPKLLRQAHEVRNDIPYMVILAHREYETWFLASAESLRGCAGLSNVVVPPENPEAIRGAKEWLSREMQGSYDPIQHQASFTAKFNFNQARRIPSFNRFVEKLII